MDSFTMWNRNGMTFQRYSSWKGCFTLNQGLRVTFVHDPFGQHLLPNMCQRMLTRAKVDSCSDKKLAHIFS